MTPLALFLNVQDVVANEIASVLASAEFTRESKGRYRRLGDRFAVDAQAIHEAHFRRFHTGEIHDVVEFLVRRNDSERVPLEVLSGYWRRRAQAAESETAALKSRLEDSEKKRQTQEEQYRRVRRPFLLTTSAAAHQINKSASTFRKYATTLRVVPEQVVTSSVGHGAYRRDHTHYLWAPEDVQRIREIIAGNEAAKLEKRRQKDALNLGKGKRKIPAARTVWDRLDTIGPIETIPRVPMLIQTLDIE